MYEFGIFEHIGICHLNPKIACFYIRSNGGMQGVMWEEFIRIGLDLVGFSLTRNSPGGKNTTTPLFFSAALMADWMASWSEILSLGMAQKSNTLKMVKFLKSLGIPSAPS